MRSILYFILRQFRFFLPTYMRIIVGSVLGLLGFTLLFHLTRGLQSSFERLTRDELGGDAIIFNRGLLSSSDLTVLSDHPDVLNTSEVIEFLTMVYSADQETSWLVNVALVDDKYPLKKDILRIQPFSLDEKETSSASSEVGEILKDPRSIVISEGLRENLKSVTQDRLTILNHSYIVRGFIEKDLFTPRGLFFQREKVYVSLRAKDQFLLSEKGTTLSHYVYVELKPGRSLSDFKLSIKKSLPSVVIIDSLSANNQFARVLDVIVGSFNLISLFGFIGLIILLMFQFQNHKLIFEESLKRLYLMGVSQKIRSFIIICDFLLLSLFLYTIFFSLQKIIVNQFIKWTMGINFLEPFRVYLSENLSIFFSSTVPVGIVLSLYMIYLGKNFFFPDTSFISRHNNFGFSKYFESLFKCRFVRRPIANFFTYLKLKAFDEPLWELAKGLGVLLVFFGIWFLFYYYLFAFSSGFFFISLGVAFSLIIIYVSVFLIQFLLKRYLKLQSLFTLALKSSLNKKEIFILGVTGLILYFTFLFSSLFIYRSLQLEFEVPSMTEEPQLFLFDVSNESYVRLREGERSGEFKMLAPSPFVRGEIVSVNGNPEWFRLTSGKNMSEFSGFTERRIFNFTVRKETTPAEVVLEKLEDSRLKKGELPMSLEKRFADRFGFRLGDLLELEYLSDKFLLRVMEIRKVKWHTFYPNFFIQIKDLKSKGGEEISVFSTFDSWVIGLFHPQLGISDLRKKVSKLAPEASVIDPSKIKAEIKLWSDRILNLIQILFLPSIFIFLFLSIVLIQSLVSERKKLNTFLQSAGVSSKLLTRYVFFEVLLLLVISTFVGFGLGYYTSYFFQNQFL